MVYSVIMDCVNKLNSKLFYNEITFSHMDDYAIREDS
jgi:hypothetical protein